MTDSSFRAALERLRATAADSGDETGSGTSTLC